MTRIVLIHAGPTPWDSEGRLTGNHTQPLTDDARRAIEDLVPTLPEDVTAVYRCKSNEACDEVAKLVAKRHKLKPRHSDALDAINLGLWQGLTRDQLRFRFSTAFPRWEENPAGIIPPDGESFEHALDRLREGARKIVRKEQGRTIVIAMRPMAQQMLGGILRGKSPEHIAAHLHKACQLETIELDESAERKLLD